MHRDQLFAGLLGPLADRVGHFVGLAETNPHATLAVAHKTTKSATSGGKERIQAFEGILIAIKGQKDDKTFTVLKVAGDAVRIE
ncbi:50S ribosomal protein L19, partial [bacterium]|nr:50S ribosomal protein L19 [bacterium]